MLTIEYRGKRCSFIVSEKTLNRIIDVFYPDKGARGVSKGYVELVNFFFGK